MALPIDLSLYASKLGPSALAHYKEIISTVGVYPYHILLGEYKSALSCTGPELPKMAYPHIYHYLVHGAGTSR